MNKSNISSKISSYVDNFWNDEIIPELVEYIKIPNKSPAFDKNWEENGYMEKVLKNAVKWAKKQAPEKSVFHIKKANGKTPLILIGLFSIDHQPVQQICQT